MTREELQNQSKDILITWLLNDEYQIEFLRERLYKLTGCREFGNLDGMNGACVECSYNEKELFDKCWNFKFDKK